MVTSLNVDTALRQEELELEGEIEFETLVEIALREYIQRRKQPKHLDREFWRISSVHLVKNINCTNWV